jgi:hypothetical protein
MIVLVSKDGRSKKLSKNIEDAKKDLNTGKWNVDVDKTGALKNYSPTKEVKKEVKKSKKK